MSQARFDAGLVHWPALADLAGLPAQGWQASLLWSRQDAGGDRSITRLEQAGLAPVIVKQAHRELEAPVMAAGVVAQQRAAAVLADHPFAGVPRILAHLPDRRAVLIEAVPGLPLADLLQGAGAAAAIRRAGVWLDAFHRTGPLTRGRFPHRFTVRRAMRAARAVAAKTLQIPKPGLFMAHMASLQASASLLSNSRTMLGPRHGDLNGGNLLMGDRLVWGIDFGPDVRGPTCVDIARLLTHVAVRTSDPATGSLATGSGSLRSAFFAGYDLDAAEDPVLPYLMRAELLADWARYPADTTAMTPPQFARFRRTVALVAELSAEA